MSFDASPLMSHEPSSQWRVDANEGAEADGFLLHQQSEKQYNKEHEERTIAAEHDTSEPARTARRYHTTQPLKTHCTRTAALLSTVSLIVGISLLFSYLVWRAALGEVCGTFLLVFVACGTPVATHRLSTETDATTAATSPILTLFINNVTVALAIIGLIYSLASVSGAHMNPAVTFALWTSHLTSARKLMLYVVAQLIGGLLAILTLLLCYDWDTSVLQHTAVARPSTASLYSVFLMELLLTFTLVFVILRVSFDNIEAEKRQTMQYRSLLGSAVGLTIAPTTNARLGYAPIAIGFLIVVLGVVGGGVSGASMNPVRYVVPAAVNGAWDVWMAVYVLGELGGACLAVGLSQVFNVTGQMAERSAEKAAELRQLQQPMTALPSLASTAVAASGGTVLTIKTG